MFKIAVVIFRESLEIALLLGVIMAVTRPIENSRTYIVLGALLGLVAASLFAFFARSLSVLFGGVGDELFDACVILLTSAIISWTVIWMQGYTKRIKRDLGELSDKIASGTTSQFMLVLVVAATIFREGVEILLFIYSIASTETIRVNEYITGLGIGAFLGLVVGIIIYLGLVNFAGKYAFKISTILLILIAAGLASEAAGILTSSGIIDIMSGEIWDSSWLINDNSEVGRILNVITGYVAKPNELQITFYFTTIILNLLIILIRKSIVRSTEKAEKNV